VRRAIRLVEAELEKEKGPLYSLGPLIHNRQAVDWLREKGLEPLEDPAQIRSGRVVIRAHGISPADLAELQSRGLEVVDCTCPLVRRVQERARSLAEQGYRVVVVGERDHPEVKGIVGWSGPDTIVLASVAEAEGLPPMQKVGVVAQTTQPVERFRQVVEVLHRKATEVVAEETVCQATRERQEATRRLAQEAEVLVVVGSADSANTARLVEICRASGKPTYRVEEARDLCPQWLARASRVGVTAGASTPDWIIEEVVRKMWEIEENKEQQNLPAEAASAEAPPEPQGEAGKPGEDRPVEAGGAEAAEPEARAAESEESPGSEAQCAQSEEDVGAGSRAAEADGENLGLEEAMVSSFTFRRGDIIRGTVVQINNGEVLVDVGAKSEGIIPLSELSYRRIERPEEVVKVGDELEVYVIRPENEEGHPILSKRRADRKRAWERLEEAYESGGVIEAQASEVVKGGLLVDLGVRGFVPASLVGRGYVEDLNGLVGKTLRLKVIELDRGKNKVVLSQKAVLEEEYQKQRAETWASLAEGQVRKGVVRRLTNFGAFVDLGGVDGLLHVSEISWGRVEHPRDVLQEGQELEVKVLGVDRERERVSLGLKQLQPNPWDTAAERYPAGSIVNGKVLRLTSFGAFVEVEPGIEGLVHISQLADRRVERPEEVVKVGDIIPVKVLSVDQTAQRMSLSLKQAQRETGARQPAARQETENDSGGVTIGELVGNLFEERR
jgi:4-hydroxy-3-methylbut-2-enyl diphosphate reductase